MTRRIAVDPAPPEHRSTWRRWSACCAGQLPAEVLSQRDREDLLAHLHARGWSDVDIATHTRMSTYTTARIRNRLGLVPHEGEAT